MKRVTTSAETSESLIDPTFSAAVIAWQKQHGRHALPWQNTRDAYRIWLSEIMLQQTQVTAVIPYYQKFLRCFPTVESLAAAASEAVMSQWSGLGYYTRARNLHQCAQRVTTQYGGRFPEDPELLADLPGIGRSTAAAIAAFAYSKRAAILDGNVKRVFARVFGVEGFPGAKAVEDQLWQRAVALLPQTDMESYTQGLMDLGATLCVRGKPDCGRCPLASRCVALATGRTSELPVRKPRKRVPEKDVMMLIIVNGDEVLLQQRPDNGIWGGLLSLPELPPNDDADAAALTVRSAMKPFGIIAAYRQLRPFSHVFTHFKLHISPYHVELKTRHSSVADATYVWYPIAKLAGAPLPAPVKKLLSEVVGATDLLSQIAVISEQEISQAGDAG